MLTDVQLLNVYLKAYTHKVASTGYTVKEAGMRKAITPLKSVMFKAIKRDPLLVKGLGLRDGITAGMPKYQKRRLMRHNFNKNFMPTYGTTVNSKFGYLPHPKDGATYNTPLNGLLYKLFGRKTSRRIGNNGNLVIGSRKRMSSGELFSDVLKGEGRTPLGLPGIVGHEFGHAIANALVKMNRLTPAELNTVKHNIKSLIPMTQRNAAHKHTLDNIPGIRGIIRYKPTLRKVVKYNSDNPIFKRKTYQTIKVDEAFADAFGHKMESMLDPAVRDNVTYKIDRFSSKVLDKLKARNKGLSKK